MLVGAEEACLGECALGVVREIVELDVQARYVAIVVGKQVEKERFEAFVTDLVAGEVQLLGCVELEQEGFEEVGEVAVGLGVS